MRWPKGGGGRATAVRLLVAYLLACALPVLLTGWFVATTVRASIERRALIAFTDGTASSMEIIGDTLLRDGIDRDALASVGAVSDRIGRRDGLRATFRVVVPSGLVLYQSGPGPVSPLGLTEDARRALQGVSTSRYLEERPGWLDTEERPFQLWVPVRIGGKVIAALEVTGTSERLAADVGEDMAAVRLWLLLAFGGLAAVLLPIAAFTATRLNRSAVERQRLLGTDPLTGLATRTVLHERLASELANAPDVPCGLLVIDLDDFTAVNEALSHAAGDRILGRVARLLVACARPRDTVFRIGGDEFAVLSPGADAAAIEATADRMLAALGQPFADTVTRIALGASIGVVVFPTDGGDPETLLRHADFAQQAAKEQHLGRSRFVPDAQREHGGRLQVTQELRAALDGEDGVHLELHYQPIVAAAERTIVAMETLVRLRDASGALLPPDRFLAAAERAGLMQRLSLQVVRGAIEQLAVWRRAGHAVVVSLNLSPSDLADPTVVDHVERLLAQHDIPPGAAQIELTEKGYLANPQTALALLERLQGLGVLVALDDFGVGSSSLTYLRTIGADTVKIDRSFVTGIEHDLANRRIVRSLVDLAHTLGMNVVAEGVETEEQLQLLAGLGCDLVQGFLFSRPVPADRAGDLLRDGIGGAVVGRAA